MRRLVSFATVMVLVVACGGTPTVSGDASSTPGAGLSTDAVGGDTGGRPSGAKVRVVNVYNDGTGSPGSIDVYAAPWVLAGAKPLLSVPYGTATDFFDPTVSDEQGDMFLSFYRHGQTGNGTELMSQDETLKGGEVITFVLMSDAEKAADGSPKLYLQALFHGPRDSFSDATPAPGQGILLVNMHGTEGIVQAPVGTSWFLGAGTGCKKAIGDDQYTQTAAGPGDGTRYAFDPGDLVVSLNPSAADAGADCSTPPLISGVKVNIVADQTTLLIVYAAAATDIRTMALSLAK
jgi:hypothetical protein